MSRYQGVESVSQSVPVQGEHVELVDSLPLYDLEGVAPRIHHNLYTPNKVLYPFSNDENLPYFEQLRARTDLPEYRQASNRVALLVGESSLAAAIQYIPEDTILLVDQSFEMCVFMKRYIEALREAESIADWAKFMKVGDQEFLGTAVYRHFGTQFEVQAHEAEKNGYKHPLQDEAEFKKAQAFAQTKAIVPWHADIGSSKNMQALAAALKERKANITMMNLTNVIHYDTRFKKAKHCATKLKELPITEQAPIMTTSMHPKTADTKEDWRRMRNLQHGIAEATGPFFGLDSLSKAGRSTKFGFGRIVWRKYHKSTRPERTKLPKGVETPIVTNRLSPARTDSTSTG